MNFQQIRCVVEIVRRNLSVSEAAQSLFTSQPGVSHHVRTLEEELGVPIFVRRGKRLIGLTRMGQEIVTIAERIVLDAENLKRVARASQTPAVGDLVVATTHTQAYHALPAVIRKFLARHPGIRLSLQPCSPIEAAELVVRGEAQLCISTEVVAFFPELVLLPGPKWSRCVITPARHPLLNERRLKLASIAQYPLVTYDFAFDKHSKVRDAFERENLAPRVVLTRPVASTAASRASYTSRIVWIRSAGSFCRQARTTAASAGCTSGTSCSMGAGTSWRCACISRNGLSYWKGSLPLRVW